MDPKTTSRRSFLRLAAAGLPVAAGLAACGGSGPSQTGAGGGGGGASSGAGGGGGGASGSATYWFLSTQPAQGIREDQVKRFNSANSKTQIKYTEFQNDAYKQKIKTAIGAGQGPTLIWGWGGGGLKSYVDANQVVDLTSWMNGEQKALKDKIFPSSFGAATVNGKIYAMPVETVTPIVFFWNKQVFAKTGAQPPKTWTDVENLIDFFNKKGIAPFSLGGQSRWTNMMWLEFILDRLAGSSVFQNVFEGKKNAWSDPAVEKMLTMIQDMVKKNAFIKGFSSMTADSNADVAVFFSGKAAMMLHGAWTYGYMKDNSSIVKSGNLGYMNFPPIPGGKGDPSDTVGNPGQYNSISSKASAAQQDIAKKFLANNTLDDASLNDWITKAGQVPVVKGTRDKLAAVSDKNDAAWLTFIYDTASKAKNFAQSWDQALPPTQAETLLDNIAKLFQLQVSPKQWIANMNAVIGK